jgi:hypothetical protein
MTYEVYWTDRSKSSHMVHLFEIIELEGHLDKGNGKGDLSSSIIL